MAMKKRYHTVNGMLIGETSNGVRRGYLPDALGSVVATVDGNGAIENTYRYKPYGSLLDKTGTAADPRFMWVGVLGYRTTRPNPLYVRARHFDTVIGAWLTIDMEWPFERAYGYVNACPVTLTDAQGLSGKPEAANGIQCQCRMRTIPLVLNVPGQGYTTRPREARHPITDLYRCLFKACDAWCQTLTKMPQTLNHLCPQHSNVTDPINCRSTTIEFEPCTKHTNGDAWAYCGPRICGSHEWGNGDHANDSNWPSPMSQCCATKSLCCEECRMRVCCAVIAGALSAWEVALRKCTKKHK